MNALRNKNLLYYFLEFDESINRDDQTRMTDEWMDDGYENQYKGQGIMTINVIKIKELFVRTQCMPKNNGQN